MTKRTTLDTGWDRAGCREFDERHYGAMNDIDVSDFVRQHASVAVDRGYDPKGFRQWDDRHLY